MNDAVIHITLGGLEVAVPLVALCGLLGLAVRSLWGLSASMAKRDAHVDANTRAVKALYAKHDDLQGEHNHLAREVSKLQGETA